MDANTWEASKYGGRNYFIPVYKDNVEGYDFMFRKELVDKYGWNTAGVKTLADLEPMLADAKEAGFGIPKAFYEDKDIVSINMDDRSLGWGGTFFHMQFYSSADVYRVDYGKYIRGEADFIYHGEILSPPEKYEHAYIKSKFFGKVAVSGKNNKKAKEYYLGNNGYLDESDDEQFLFTQIERMFRVLIIVED